MKILLVEDESIIALLETQAITRFGYEVVVARTGEKAVEIAISDQGIGLILMDINLGEGIDGFEVAQRILARRSLPIVFLTAHTEKEYLHRAEEISRYGYVTKNSGDFTLRSSIETAFELFNGQE